MGISEANLPQAPHLPVRLLGSESLALTCTHGDCPLSGPLARGPVNSSSPGADGKGDGAGSGAVPTRVRWAVVMVKRRDWEGRRVEGLRPQSPFREAESPACSGRHEGQPRVAEGRWDGRDRAGKVVGHGSQDSDTRLSPCQSPASPPPAWRNSQRDLLPQLQA